MSVVPVSKVGKIEFYENHVTQWAANAVAIGTTTTAVTDLQTKTEAARDAFNAQQAAQEAAKAKTLAFNNAVEAMATAGAAIISAIRTKAKTAGDSVYVLAEIPAPATPSPVGPPGLPEALVAALKPNGTVELTWKCNNPPGSVGTIYQVYRKVDATGSYEYLGGSGERKFVDLTVPSGVPSVMYQIQGTRSTSVGDAAEFVVNFGVGGTGATVATAGDNSPAPAKIAA